MLARHHPMRNRCPLIVFRPHTALAMSFVVLLAGCVRYEAKPLMPDETAAELEQRSLANDSLRQFLAAQLGQDVSPWPPRSWDLEMLTLAAFYYHPSLAVARAEWEAAKARQITAGERPNPTLGVTPQYAFNAGSGMSPWLAIIDLDVPIETASKRAHRLENAQQLSDSARFGIAQTTWQVRGGVRDAVLRLSVLRRRQSLLEDRQHMHDTIVRLLEERLALGAIERPIVSVARVAHDRAQVELIDTARDLADARAAVAAAVGVPLSTLDPATIADPFVDCGVPDVERSALELRQRALIGRADVLAALAEYSAAQAQLQLEIAKQYPDVHLGTGYEYDQGEHKWALGLTAELPILNRNQGPIAETEARRSELRARFLELQSRVIADLDRAFESLRAARRQLALVDQLVETQRRHRSSIERQLAAGAADRLDVASARLELSQDQAARLDAELALHEAMGRLEDATQRPLDTCAYNRDARVE